MWYVVSVSEKSGQSSRRDQTSIDLTPEAARKIDAFVSERGGRGTKKFVVSKLVDWFARQPDTVKFAIIGWVPGDARSEYAGLLRHLADEIQRPPKRIDDRHPEGGGRRGDDRINDR
jgi:hypothetical protein